MKADKRESGIRFSGQSACLRDNLSTQYRFSAISKRKSGN